MPDEPRPLTEERLDQIRRWHEREWFDEASNVQEAARAVEELLSALDHSRQEVAAAKAELSAARKQWNDLDTRNEKRHREWSDELSRVTAERDLLAGLLEQFREWNLPNGKRVVENAEATDFDDEWCIIGEDGFYPTALDAIRAALKEPPMPDPLTDDALRDQLAGIPPHYLLHQVISELLMLRAQNATLREYARHAEGCVAPLGPYPCTCGFDREMLKLKQEAQGNG